MSVVRGLRTSVEGIVGSLTREMVKSWRFAAARHQRSYANLTAPRIEKMLRLIAVFKLLEGLLILVLAVGVLKLLHHDVAGLASEWITALRIDPHNEYIHWLLAKLGVLDDHRLAKQITHR